MLKQCREDPGRKMAAAVFSSPDSSVVDIGGERSSRVRLLSAPFFGSTWRGEGRGGVVSCRESSNVDGDVRGVGAGKTTTVVAFSPGSGGFVRRRPSSGPGSSSSLDLGRWVRG
jgi:hypothetical protein